MVRVLIVYDTRYGSTKTIAPFDFIVIGSPIYEEHPLPSVMNFLAENRDHLKEKDVALFVVCMDYGAMPKEGLAHRYTADLRTDAANRVRAIEVFGGYLDVDKLSAADRKLIEEFAKLMGVPITQVNKLDKQSAHKFGVQVAHLSERPSLSNN